MMLTLMIIGVLSRSSCVGVNVRKRFCNRAVLVAIVAVGTRCSGFIKSFILGKREERSEVIRGKSRDILSNQKC